MRSASFIFNFKSVSEANIVLKSIDPEIRNKIPKIKVQVKLDKNKFFINISAYDTSSLRAAINSYLRWINTALEVNKIL